MDLRDCNVLVVDDIRANINILKKVLAEVCEVNAVEDGASALEYVAHHLTDLILLDIIMPDMDGYEVCRRLKEEESTKDIPVIFITSKGEESDEYQGLELGAVDYITKPFSKAIIRARVRNHLEMKKQRDLLSDLANLDGLTGIPNRRSMEIRLEREWKRSIRSGMPVSLLMIDVDCFKQYNDNYGHAAGDDCLKEVARVLAEAVKRPADFTARYGGEEFVVLLPDVNEEGAVSVGENIRREIEALNLPHEHSRAAACVTISLGAATIIPKQTTALSDLMKAADDALYEAKENGRNQVKSTTIEVE